MVVAPALQEPLLRDQRRLEDGMELELRRRRQARGAVAVLELRLQELLLAGRLGPEAVGGLEAAEGTVGARRRRSMDQLGGR